MNIENPDNPKKPFLKTIGYLVTSFSSQPTPTCAESPKNSIIWFYEAPTSFLLDFFCVPGI